MSSLWDSQPQQPQEAVGGLRQGRGQMGRNGGGGAPPPRNNPFARQQQNATLQPQVEARPLPSQRAGSYQTAQPTPPGSSSGFASAKDRLKGKLDRGRASPAPSSNSTSSTGGGGYEDRYAGGGGGGGAYDSGRGGDRPFVAATSPWASSESEFGGGGYGSGGYDSGRRSEGRQGLPSGPRAGRGPGLPSGPRGPR